jgi:hypothetical protein
MPTRKVLTRMAEYAVNLQGYRKYRRAPLRVFAPCIREAEAAAALAWPGKRVTLSRLAESNGHHTSMDRLPEEYIMATF